LVFHNVIPFTSYQLHAARAAGEEAKLIVAAAIDAHIELIVQQLKQADDTLLGGEANEIVAFLQAQLQQAVAATESPPPSAFPCILGSPAALALAAAYMTSEMKPISASAQFCPTDKEQFRTRINQMLPPLGHIRTPVPTSPPRIHDCDMPPPPLPHFDFSQFPAPPSFDFGNALDALGAGRREVKGVRGGRGGPARHAVDRFFMNEALEQQQNPQHQHRVQFNPLSESAQPQGSSNSAAALFLHPRDTHSGPPPFAPAPVVPGPFSSVSRNSDALHSHCAFSVGGGNIHSASNGFGFIRQSQHVPPVTTQPFIPVFGGNRAFYSSGNPVHPDAPPPAPNPRLISQFAPDPLPHSQPEGTSPAAAGPQPLPGSVLKNPLR
jgi:hypothetical protein